MLSVQVVVSRELQLLLFWQKKGDQYLKVLLASKFFCRLFSTCFSFVSLNVHRIVG